MKDSQKIVQSFSVRDTLNPKVWDNASDPKRAIMKQTIRQRLLDIANQFQDFIGLDIFVSDIQLTGSLSNYNWSDFSDFDLHLIIDFNQFPKNKKELYSELFKLKKTLFNLQHNIKIHNFDVELYAQDSSEEHTSTGIYSVLNNEWIVIPKKEDFKIDKSTLMKKVESWMIKIDETIEQAKDQKDLKTSLDYLNKMRTKIKDYRKLGLSKEGEFSYENLVFKFLRRNGYIQKLFDFENEHIDKKLSLEGFLFEQAAVEETLQSPMETNTPYVNKNNEFRTRARPNHNGIDFGVPSGSKLYAIADGTVSVADIDGWYGGCGGTLIVKHANGIQSTYCHCKEIFVKPGQVIKKGNIIGLSGGAKNDKGRGNSTGAHLHFAIKENGNRVNPRDYINFNIGAQVRLGKPDGTEVISPQPDSETPTDPNKKTDGTDINAQIEKGKEKLKDLGDKAKEKLSDIGSIFSSGIFKIFQKDLSERLQKLIDKNVVLDFKNQDASKYDFRLVPVEKAMEFLNYAKEKYYVSAKYNEKLLEFIRKFKEDNGLPQDDVIDKDDLEKLRDLVKEKEGNDIEGEDENKGEDGDKKPSEPGVETAPVTQISSDDSFYKKILTGLGAPITNENLKFLYGWRQSEGGEAQFNPFNTIWDMGEDKENCYYNCLKSGTSTTPIKCRTCPEGYKPGVRNYKTEQIGLEATLKTLNQSSFSCITDGLKNNIGAAKISECQSLNVWGTGKVLQDVIAGYDSGASIKAPPIQRA